MNRRLKWLGTLVLACFLCDCSGPSCESACQKAFSTCALTFLDTDSSIDEQISECTQACSESMRDPSQEAVAVGWVGCVNDFSCESADDGETLCLTCQSGYYYGRTSGNACGSGDDASQ